MRRAFVIALVALVSVAGLLLAALLGAAVLLGTPKGPPLLESALNRVGAGLAMPFRLEGLGGSLWHSPTLGTLTLSDSEGVWLTARGIAAVWSPGGLLAGRRFVESLAVESVTLHRRPLVADDGADDDGAPLRPLALLAYMPKTVRLHSLVVEPPVTGVSHTLQGSVSYAEPGPTALTLATLEGPATTLSGTVALVATGDVSATLLLAEQPNGLLGGLLGLPPSALSATVVAEGPPDHLRTTAELALSQPNRRARLDASGPVNLLEPSATLAVSGTFVENRQVFRLAGTVAATPDAADIPAFSLRGPGTQAGGRVAWQREPRRVEGSVSATVASLTPFSAFLTRDLSGGFAFSAEGHMEGADVDVAVNLSRLDLRYQGHAIRLAAPARATWADGRGTLSPLRLTVAGGTLSAQGTLTERTAEAVVDFANLNVAALYPNPYLAGRLGGSARLTGTPAQPALAFDARFAGQSEGHAIRAEASGAWRGDTLAMRTSAASGPGRMRAETRLSATLSLLPFRTTLGPQSALAGTVEGSLPLSMLNPYLWASRQHVEGNLAANLALAGTLAEPRPTGTIRASDVSYSHGPSGICINGLAATVAGDTTRLVLQSLTARDAGGGSLTGQGSLGLEGNKPINATLTMADYGLFCGGLATGAVGGRINATGTLREHTLAGRLALGPLNIQIPGAGPTQKPIPQIQTVRAGEERDAERRRPSRTRLDIAIDAPNQIFVRGRGLDAEFGGTLAVHGTTRRPDVTGSLAAIRGTFEFFDRTLRLGDTSLRFEGAIPPSPYLDVNATSQVNGNTIGIAMTGPAAKPTLSLTSTPAMPQDEILAQLLFGRTLATITPFQAVQLAQAARTLAGLDGGDPGIIGSARAALGLDTLDVGTDTDNNVTVTTGKYLSDDIYLSIQQGAREQDREVRTEIELTPSVSGYTSVNGLGQQTFGIQWKRDY